MITSSSTDQDSSNLSESSFLHTSPKSSSIHHDHSNILSEYHSIIPTTRTTPIPKLILSFSLVVLISFFVCYMLLSYILPPLSHSEYELLLNNIPPKQLNQIKIFIDVLSKYTLLYYYQVLSCICILYLLILSLSIPGTLMLNVLFGALYSSSQHVVVQNDDSIMNPILGVLFPFIISLWCGTIGASLAYMYSHLYFGRLLIQIPSIHKFFKKFQNLLLNYEHRLFFLLLFLRISPILPNWSVNLLSPLVGISFPLFFITTLIGIAPQTFISVQSGMLIREMFNEWNQQDEQRGIPNTEYSISQLVMKPQTLMILFSISLLTLLPLMVDFIFKPKVLPIDRSLTRPISDHHHDEKME